MSASLTEILHGLRGSPWRDKVAVALLYLENGGSATSTTADLRGALAGARVRGAKTANLSDVLGSMVPLVEVSGRQGGANLWRLTSSGRRHAAQFMDGATPEVAHEAGSLAGLAANVSNANARAYVEESIKCLEVDALRAAVVFLWSGSVELLRDGIWLHGSRPIDASLKVHNPRAREFKKRDDFAYVKDSMLLQVAQDLGIIDKTEKQRLSEALDLRNSCGHPTKYRPGVKKVASFIEDLVTIVFDPA